MGAASSKKKLKKRSFTDTIDYVATNFILTQTFTDMKKLANEDYCNKLIILTADVIANNLTGKKIKYLSQRIEGGVEEDVVSEESVIFIKKKGLENLDSNKKKTNKSLCIGIARFYVRIAHLFAAIVMTINPTYVYNINGKKYRMGILDKNIPKDAKRVEEAGVESVNTSHNICSLRIDALKSKNDYKTGEGSVNIGKVCEMNNKSNSSGGHEVKNLEDEHGMKELEMLYKDSYDFKTGEFRKMTKEMEKEEYKKDLEELYKTFTGNKDIPLDEKGNSKIKSFRDINLKDFNSSPNCTDEDRDKQYFKKNYTGEIGQDDASNVFKKYGEHVKQMMEHSDVNRNKLIKIIDKVFVYGFDENSPDKKTPIIKINPVLTDDALTEITKETRNIIIGLYLTCERDFTEGVKMFEGIAEQMELRETKDDLESLHKDISKEQDRTHAENEDELEKQRDYGEELDKDKKKLIEDDEENTAERNEMINRGEIGREEENERNLKNREVLAVNLGDIDRKREIVEKKIEEAIKEKEGHESVGEYDKETERLAMVKKEEDKKDAIKNVADKDAGVKIREEEYVKERTLVAKEDEREKKAYEKKVADERQLNKFRVLDKDDILEEEEEEAHARYEMRVRDEMRVQDEMRVRDEMRRQYPDEAPSRRYY